jgi:hypothetical protein
MSPGEALQPFVDVSKEYALHIFKVSQTEDRNLKNH